MCSPNIPPKCLLHPRTQHGHTTGWMLIQQPTCAAQLGAKGAGGHQARQRDKIVQARHDVLVTSTTSPPVSGCQVPNAPPQSSILPAGSTQQATAPCADSSEPLKTTNHQHPQAQKQLSTAHTCPSLQDPHTVKVHRRQPPSATQALYLVKQQASSNNTTAYPAAPVTATALSLSLCSAAPPVNQPRLLCSQCPSHNSNYLSVPDCLSCTLSVLLSSGTHILGMDQVVCRRL